MNSAPGIIRRKVDESGFVEFCHPLLGLPVTHVWRGYGSTIFLEFGRLSSTTRLDGKKGNPRGEMELMIEWSWRIESSRSILCGSWSSDALWPKTFSKLKKSKVTNISLFGRLREIELKLSNRLNLFSFSTVEGYPHWTLFNNKSRSWLSGRNGILCVEKNSGRKI